MDETYKVIEILEKICGGEFTSKVEQLVLMGDEAKVTSLKRHLRKRWWRSMGGKKVDAEIRLNYILGYDDDDEDGWCSSCDEDEAERKSQTCSEERSQTRDEEMCPTCSEDDDSHCSSVD